jgi:hypothetical protein
MAYPRLHYPNPVTRVPVQYPAGIPAAAERLTSQDSASLAALPSPPKNVKELTTRLAELEQQINLSIGYDATENLVNAFGYYREDFRYDNLQVLFTSRLDHDLLPYAEVRDPPAVYQSIQPVIHVAPDGKSATIRARLLKVGGKSGGLASGIYEGRAVRVAGAWKLQSLTLKPTWSSAFTQWTPTVERR